MTLSSLELMLLDTPCKPRKHSWSGACSLVSSSTSLGDTSSALLPTMLPVRTANKSQLTGLVEWAIWSQTWIWGVKVTRRTRRRKKVIKPKVTKQPKSEHLNDLRDPSVYTFIWN